MAEAFGYAIKQNNIKAVESRDTVYSLVLLLFFD